MPPLHIHITARVLTIIFLIGVAGCLISIPIIAFKFASVLFERDTDDETQPDGEGGSGVQGKAS